jgi:hypothetical protein
MKTLRDALKRTTWFNSPAAESILSAALDELEELRLYRDARSDTFATVQAQRDVLLAVLVRMRPLFLHSPPTPGCCEDCDAAVAADVAIANARGGQ